MTQPPTTADRAAAREIIVALACHGQLPLGPSRAAVERYATIIAKHMAPERARVEVVIRACRNSIAIQIENVSCDVIIATLSPPSSETEEPKT